MRALLSVLLALQLLGSAGPAPDPFAFFEPGAVLTTAERQRLDRGVPLVKILPADGQQLAVLSAVSLGPHVTPERTATWIRNVEELRRNSYVLDTRRFSNPPRREDLDSLTLDAQDLDDLRNCRPGHCDVKLTAAEIGQLRAAMTRGGAAWRTAAQDTFREIVLRRVMTYLDGGHQAFEPYWDHKHPSSPHRALAALFRELPFLRLRLPAAGQLAECPAAFPRDETFLYWSRERLGGKIVIAATHVAVVSAPDRAAPEALSIGVQIFATHYLEGAIGVTAFVRDERGRAYLVYVNRSDVDVLTGLWGGVARSIIESRLRKDGPAILAEVSSRVAADPPARLPPASPMR